MFDLLWEREIERERLSLWTQSELWMRDRRIDEPLLSHMPKYILTNYSMGLVGCTCNSSNKLSIVVRALWIWIFLCNWWWKLYFSNYYLNDFEGDNVLPMHREIIDFGKKKKKKEKETFWVAEIKRGETKEDDDFFLKVGEGNRANDIVWRRRGKSISNEPL